MKDVMFQKISILPPRRVLRFKPLPTIEIKMNVKISP